MNNFKEPIYLVAFRSAICNYEIYINNLPAYIHLEGGSVSSQIPINQLLFESGKQEIKIRIFPLDGEVSFSKDSFIEVKVFSYDSSTANYENTIESFNFKIEDLNNLKIPIVHKNDYFIAEVPYKLKTIDSFDEIKDKKPEIISFYKEIFTLFKNQEVQKIYNLLKFRFDEIDEATYSKESDNMAGLTKMMSRLKEGEFELVDFPVNPILIIYENKRVCNLLRENKEPLLFLKNKSNSEFSFPLLISFENSKPIIVR